MLNLLPFILLALRQLLNLCIEWLRSLMHFLAVDLPPDDEAQQQQQQQQRDDEQDDAKDPLVRA
jgi:hypothetical protein